MNRTYKIGLRTLVFMLVCIALVCYCSKHEPIHVYEPMKKQEQKRETIKSKIVLKEKHLSKVKEQQATIKECLQVARKGLILDVDTIINDTAKIEQVIKVIELQGLVISADSGIIALQDTLLSHYKTLDSTNTNIMTEIKEVAKEDIKQAKKKGFKNGLAIGIVTALIVVITISIR